MSHLSLATTLAFPKDFLLGGDRSLHENNTNAFKPGFSLLEALLGRIAVRGKQNPALHEVRGARYLAAMTLRRRV